MRIGVDVRSLLDMRRGGVPHYTFEVLKALVATHPKDEWHLVQTGRTAWRLPKELARPNVRLHHRRLPNKLHNAGVTLTGRPRLDSGLELDVFFAPNLGFIRLGRTPLVLTVHDVSYAINPDWYGPDGRRWHRLVRPTGLLRQAARLIAVSDQTKAELGHHYDIPARRITVVPSGIDDVYRRPVSKSALARVACRYRLPESFYLYLGAFEPRKNVDGLLTAFATARAQGLRSDLILAGSGRPGRLPSGARHLGYLPEADKPALYRLARAVVLVSWHEGFGFPPLEALAIGTPSLVSDLPVFQSTLGRAAVRVPPGDTGRIAAKLVDLERHPERRRRLVRQGASIISNLTWQRTAEATYQVLIRASHHHA